MNKFELIGLQRLMEIASEMEEMSYESSMQITANTRPTVAVCMGQVFEHMYYDQARERFTNKIEEFMALVFIEAFHLSTILI